MRLSCGILINTFLEKVLNKKGDIRKLHDTCRAAEYYGTERFLQMFRLYYLGHGCAEEMNESFAPNDIVT